jgi:hypothetical protein
MVDTESQTAASTCNLDNPEATMRTNMSFDALPAADKTSKNAAVSETSQIPNAASHVAAPTPIRLYDSASTIAPSKPTTPRVPYESGFGDFCFGRLLDRTWKERSVANTKLESHNVPMKEPDS